MPRLDIALLRVTEVQEGGIVDTYSSSLFLNRPDCPKVVSVLGWWKRRGMQYVSDVHAPFPGFQFPDHSFRNSASRGALCHAAVPPAMLGNHAPACRYLATYPGRLSTASVLSGLMCAHSICSTGFNAKAGFSQ